MCAMPVQFEERVQWRPSRGCKGPGRTKLLLVVKGVEEAHGMRRADCTEDLWQRGAGAGKVGKTRWKNNRAKGGCAAARPTSFSVRTYSVLFSLCINALSRILTAGRRERGQGETALQRAGGV